MPVIPNLTKLSGTSTDILNAISNDIGGMYQTIVPIADSTNLRQIGTAIMGSSSIMNSFLECLIGRIGKSIIMSKMYDNPWKSFKKGELVNGEMIQEIFIDMAKPYRYDPNKTDTVFKKAKPNVKAEYYTVNYKEIYKVTISREELKTAFTSETSVANFINSIISQLYSGANYDEFISMKYLLAKSALNGRFYSRKIQPVSPLNAKAVITEIKSISNGLEFMNSTYNAAGVTTNTLKDDQFLIVNTQFDAINDVEVLASAFNMGKTEFLGHKVLVDSFTFTDSELERLALLFGQTENLDPAMNYVNFTPEELEKLNSIEALLVDRNFFMIFDTLNLMKTIDNPESLYTNYFYHQWKVMSTSPFSNAILFSSIENGIESVKITPSTATVGKGKSLQFKVEVVNTSFADESVNWAIAKKSSNGTKINENGLLEVGSDETELKLNITATSNFNPLIKATTVITVE